MDQTGRLSVELKCVDAMNPLPVAPATSPLRSPLNEEKLPPRVCRAVAKTMAVGICSTVQRSEGLDPQTATNLQDENKDGEELHEPSLPVVPHPNNVERNCSNDKIRELDRREA